MFTGQVTAAGKIPPARVFVVGAGVAGLAAIGAASAMGAIVRAFDVRPEVAEQVESMGGEFVRLNDPSMEAAASSDGYAKEMTAEQEAATAAMYDEEARNADIVITTALIPGRPAPVLITEEMVRAMKPGSVIVDLAAPAGGNCPLTEPGRTVLKHNVTLIGETNLPALVAADSSALYARNVLDFLKLVLTKEGEFQIPMDDDIVAACLVARDGQVTRQ
jgi:NAD(P) transhydrogenase subunit alpha